MKKSLFFFFLLILFNRCTDSNSENILPTPTLELNNISGFLTITDQQFANSIGLSGSSKTWTLESAKVKSLLSRNLTSSPYKLELTININDDSQSPTIKFISDFDRKIAAGNRYKILTSLNLFGDNSFIPGNTGGQVSFMDKTKSYGFSIGTECEIVIAEEDSVPAGGSTQFISLEGTFTLDNTANIDRVIGSFEIQFEGNNIIDLSFF